MQILKAQAAVAEYRCTDKLTFLGAIGRLVDALMYSSGDEEWCGKFPPYVDGVLFEIEESRSDYFLGRGTAVIGQEGYVEPISVELWFNPISNKMTTATILFGMVNSTKPEYNTDKAKKIRPICFCEGNVRKIKASI